jgi:hypothetical protein
MQRIRSVRRGRQRAEVQLRGARGETGRNATTAQTTALPPAATEPVLVMVAPVVEQLPAPPSARKLTVQPAGSVTLAKVFTVLAPRL